MNYKTTGDQEQHIVGEDRLMSEIRMYLFSQKKRFPILKNSVRLQKTWYTVHLFYFLQKAQN